MADKKRTSTVTAADIKAVRGSLTQVEAAKLVPCSRRAYQSYESGTVAISEATFEYFKRQISKSNKSKGK